mgnify:CR=1 FL=1
MVPIRIALVGATKGPDLPIIMEMIGKDDVIKRIKRAPKSKLRLKKNFKIKKKITLKLKNTG